MHQAQARPGDVAFVFGEQPWTYERVAIEADRAARGMAASGVRSGDRVALHMMNRPEYIVAYFACFRIGAIAVPLRTAFKFAELAPLLQRLRPALYIGEPDLYENVAPLDTSVLPEERRFIVGAEGDVGPTWEELCEAGSDIELLAFADAERPAVLITTSGTTGEPKLVVHTPTSLACSMHLMSSNWEWFQEDVMTLPLPLAHMSGLAVFLTLYHLGATFVLLESFDANVVLDAIERHRCTVNLGFPAHYAAMLASQRVRPRDLRSLRACYTGGDVCPTDLQIQIGASFGASLHNVWAATEVCGTLASSRRPGPVVRIVDDTQILLIADEGHEAAEGETGELLVRGRNLFAGYWENPEATAQSLEGGWYHTGDLMRRRGDELEFVGRKKDIIIRGGTNISPVEVEEAIAAAHPMVEEAAVAGIPDPVLGQRVVGFVKLADGADASVVAEIRRNLEARLAVYKIPEHIAVLDALPRTALGKVDRTALQKMVSNADIARGPEKSGEPPQYPAKRLRRASTS
ncbi:class I adenylate-forming enzyme family protein [Bradyrhizobium centrolobii]|nr:class I adenylate-forming enzyme family protein [Bradyrhizobium centrolobii]